MKKCIIIILTIYVLLFIIEQVRCDGIDDVRKSIDYESQKIRYIQPIDKYDNIIDRGKITKALSKFNQMGFQPFISILPKGIQFSVGPVTISHDRRYVRIGLTPFFSGIGNVSTFKLYHD